jgi:cytochrome b561
MKAPAYPDSLPRTLQIAAKASHHLMYVLLVVVPLLGWAGVTAFPALITLGAYYLPAMPLVPQSTDLAAQLFGLHGTLAIVLTVLLIGHIGAAFRHMFKKDGIFRRMV